MSLNLADAKRLREDFKKKISDPIWVKANQGDEKQLAYYESVYGGESGDKHAGNLYSVISSLILKELKWSRMQLNLADVKKLREDFRRKISDLIWIKANQGDTKQLEYYEFIFGVDAEDKNTGKLYSVISGMIPKELGWSWMAGSLGDAKRLREDFKKKISDPIWVKANQGDENQLAYYESSFGAESEDKNAGGFYSVIASMIPKDLRWGNMFLNLADVKRLREDFRRKISDPAWVKENQGDVKQLGYYETIFGIEAGDKNAGKLYSAISSLIPKEIGWSKMLLNLGEAKKLREDFKKKTSDPAWVKANRGDEKQLAYYEAIFGSEADDKHAGGFYSVISSLIPEEMEWNKVPLNLGEAKRLRDDFKRKTSNPAWVEANQGDEKQLAYYESFFGNDVGDKYAGALYSVISSLLPKELGWHYISSPFLQAKAQFEKSVPLPKEPGSPAQRLPADEKKPLDAGARSEVRTEQLQLSKEQKDRLKKWKLQDSKGAKRLDSVIRYFAENLFDTPALKKKPEVKQKMELLFKGEGGVLDSWILTGEIDDAIKSKENYLDQWLDLAPEAIAVEFERLIQREQTFLFEEDTSAAYSTLIDKLVPVLFHMTRENMGLTPAGIRALLCETYPEYETLKEFLQFDYIKDFIPDADSLQGLATAIEAASIKKVLSKLRLTELTEDDPDLWPIVKAIRSIYAAAADPYESIETQELENAIQEYVAMDFTEGGQHSGKLLALIYRALPFSWMPISQYGGSSSRLIQEVAELTHTIEGNPGAYQGFFTALKQNAKSFDEVNDLLEFAPMGIYFVMKPPKEEQLLRMIHYAGERSLLQFQRNSESLLLVGNGSKRFDESDRGALHENMDAIVLSWPTPNISALHNGHSHPLGYEAALSDADEDVRVKRPKNGFWVVSINQGHQLEFSYSAPNDPEVKSFVGSAAVKKLEELKIIQTSRSRAETRALADRLTGALVTGALAHSQTGSPQSVPLPKKPGSPAQALFKAGTEPRSEVRSSGAQGLRRTFQPILKTNFVNEGLEAKDEAVRESLGGAVKDFTGEPSFENFYENYYGSKRHRNKALPSGAWSVYRGTAMARLKYLMKEINQPGDLRSMDLGSGDGRVVVAYGLAGYQARGVEFSWELFQEAVQLANAYFYYVHPKSDLGETSAWIREDPEWVRNEKGEITRAVVRWKNTQGPGSVELIYSDFELDDSIQLDQEDVITSWGALVEDRPNLVKKLSRMKSGARFADYYNYFQGRKPIPDLEKHLAIDRALTPVGEPFPSFYVYKIKTKDAVRSEVRSNIQKTFSSMDEAVQFLRLWYPREGLAEKGGYVDIAADGRIIVTLDEAGGGEREIQLEEINQHEYDFHSHPTEDWPSAVDLMMQISLAGHKGSLIVTPRKTFLFENDFENASYAFRNLIAFAENKSMEKPAFQIVMAWLNAVTPINPRAQAWIHSIFLEMALEITKEWFGTSDYISAWMDVWRRTGTRIKTYSYDEQGEFEKLDILEPIPSTPDEINQLYASKAQVFQSGELLLGSLVNHMSQHLNINITIPNVSDPNITKFAGTMLKLLVFDLLTSIIPLSWTPLRSVVESQGVTPLLSSQSPEIEKELKFLRASSAWPLLRDFRSKGIPDIFNSVMSSNEMSDSLDRAFPGWNGKEKRAELRASLDSALAKGLEVEGRNLELLKKLNPSDFLLQTPTSDSITSRSEARAGDLEQKVDVVLAEATKTQVTKEKKLDYFRPIVRELIREFGSLDALEGSTGLELGPEYDSTALIEFLRSKKINMHGVGFNIGSELPKPSADSNLSPRGKYLHQADFDSFLKNVSPGTVKFIISRKSFYPFADLFDSPPMQRLLSAMLEDQGVLRREMIRKKYAPLISALGLNGVWINTLDKGGYPSDEKPGLYYLSPQEAREFGLERIHIMSDKVGGENLVTESYRKIKSGMIPEAVKAVFVDLEGKEQSLSLEEVIQYVHEFPNMEFIKVENVWTATAVDQSYLHQHFLSLRNQGDGTRRPASPVGGRSEVRNEQVSQADEVRELLRALNNMAISVGFGTEDYALARNEILETLHHLFDELMRHPTPEIIRAAYRFLEMYSPVYKRTARKANVPSAMDPKIKKGMGLLLQQLRSNSVIQTSFLTPKHLVHPITNGAALKMLEDYRKKWADIMGLTEKFNPDSPGPFYWSKNQEDTLMVPSLKGHEAKGEPLDANFLTPEIYKEIHDELQGFSSDMAKNIGVLISMVRLKQFEGIDKVVSKIDKTQKDFQNYVNTWQSPEAKKFSQGEVISLDYRKQAREFEKWHAGGTRSEMRSALTAGSGEDNHDITLGSDGRSEMREGVEKEASHFRITDNLLRFFVFAGLGIVTTLLGAGIEWFFGLLVPFFLFYAPRILLIGAESKEDLSAEIRNKFFDLSGISSSMLKTRQEALREQGVVKLIEETVGLKIKALYVSGSYLYKKAGDWPNDIDFVLVAEGRQFDEKVIHLGESSKGGENPDVIYLKDNKPFKTPDGALVRKLEILIIGEGVLAGKLPENLTSTSLLHTLVNTRQRASAEILQGLLLQGEPVIIPIQSARILLGFQIFQHVVGSFVRPLLWIFSPTRAGLKKMISRIQSIGIYLRLLNTSLQRNLSGSKESRFEARTEQPIETWNSDAKPWGTASGVMNVARVSNKGLRISKEAFKGEDEKPLSVQIILGRKSVGETALTLTYNGAQWVISVEKKFIQSQSDSPDPLTLELRPGKTLGVGLRPQKWLGSEDVPWLIDQKYELDLEDIQVRLTVNAEGNAVTILDTSLSGVYMKSADIQKLQENIRRSEVRVDREKVNQVVDDLLTEDLFMRPVNITDYLFSISPKADSKTLGIISEVFKKHGLPGMGEGLSLDSDSPAMQIATAVMTELGRRDFEARTEFQKQQLKSPHALDSRSEVRANKKSGERFLAPKTDGNRWEYLARILGIRDPKTKQIIPLDLTHAERAMASNRILLGNLEEALRLHFYDLASSGLYGPGFLETLLSRALRSPHPEIRKLSVSILGGYGRVETLNVLVNLLKSEKGKDTGVHRDAMELKGLVDALENIAIRKDGRERLQKLLNLPEDWKHEDVYPAVRKLAGLKEEVLEPQDAQVESQDTEKRSEVRIGEAGGNYRQKASEFLKHLDEVVKISSELSAEHVYKAALIYAKSSKDIQEVLMAMSPENTESADTAAIIFKMHQQKKRVPDQAIQDYFEKIQLALQGDEFQILLEGIRQYQRRGLYPRHPIKINFKRPAQTKPAHQRFRPGLPPDFGRSELRRRIVSVQTSGLIQRWKTVIAAGLLGAAITVAAETAVQFHAMQSHIGQLLDRGLNSQTLISHALEAEKRFQGRTDDQIIREANVTIKSVIDTVYRSLPPEKKQAMHRLALYALKMESNGRQTIQRNAQGKAILIGVGRWQNEIPNLGDSPKNYHAYGSDKSPSYEHGDVRQNNKLFLGAEMGLVYPVTNAVNGRLEYDVQAVKRFIEEGIKRESETRHILGKSLADKVLSSDKMDAYFGILQIWRGAMTRGGIDLSTVRTEAQMREFYETRYRNKRFSDSERAVREKSGKFSAAYHWAMQAPAYSLETKDETTSINIYPVSPAREIKINARINGIQGTVTNAAKVAVPSTPAVSKITERRSLQERVQQSIEKGPVARPEAAQKGKSRSEVRYEPEKLTPTLEAAWKQADPEKSHSWIYLIGRGTLSSDALKTQERGEFLRSLGYDVVVTDESHEGLSAWNYNIQPGLAKLVKEKGRPLIISDHYVQDDDPLILATSLLHSMVHLGDLRFVMLFEPRSTSVGAWQYAKRLSVANELSEIFEARPDVMFQGMTQDEFETWFRANGEKWAKRTGAAGDFKQKFLKRIPEPGVGKTFSNVEQMPTVRIFEIFNAEFGGDSLALIDDRIKNPAIGVYWVSEEAIRALRDPATGSWKPGTVNIETGKLPNGSPEMRQAVLADHSAALLPEVTASNDWQREVIQRTENAKIEKVRISASTLARITKIVDGKTYYLLVLNRGSLKKGEWKLAPFGGAIGEITDAGMRFMKRDFGLNANDFDGVTKALRDAEAKAKKSGLVMTDSERTKIAETAERDLRFTIKSYKLRGFLQWLEDWKGRGFGPRLELTQEMGEETGLFTPEMLGKVFSRAEVRKLDLGSVLTGYNFAGAKTVLGEAIAALQSDEEIRKKRQLDDAKWEGLQNIPGATFALSLRQYQKALGDIGKRAGLKGPNVFYPFGGYDAHKPFMLVRDATNVISQSAKPWGLPNDLVTVLEARGLREGFGYDHVNTESDFHHLMRDTKTEAFGGIAIARIVNYLDGNIRGLYYFKLDEKGQPVFLDSPEQTNKRENYQHAVVEFDLKNDDGSLRHVRYWYIQDRLEEKNPNYESFVTKLDFQTLLLLGIPKEIWAKHLSVVISQIFDTAKINRARFLSDNGQSGSHSTGVNTPEALKKAFGSSSLSSLSLSRGVAVGYSSGVVPDFIYYGDAGRVSSFTRWFRRSEARKVSQAPVLASSEETLRNSSGTATFTASTRLPSGLKDEEVRSIIEALKPNVEKVPGTGSGGSQSRRAEMRHPSSDFGLPIVESVQSALHTPKSLPTGQAGAMKMRSEARKISAQEIIPALYKKAGLEFKPHEIRVTGKSEEGTFVRTALADMDEIVRLFPVSKGKSEKIIDAGHGDGAFLILLAHAFPEAELIGVELDPELYARSLKLVTAAESEGLIRKGQIRLYNDNFNTPEFERYFKSADAVYYYSSGTTAVDQLAKTILKNLKPGGEVVEYGPEELGKELKQKEGVFGERTLEFDPTAESNVFTRIHVYSRLYKIHLKQLARDTWLSQREDGKEFTFQVLEPTPELINEHYEDFFELTPGALLDEQVVQRRAQPIPDWEAFVRYLKQEWDAEPRDSILLVADAHIMGIYIFKKRPNESLFSYAEILEKYKGSGAIDVIFQDVKERYLENDETAKVSAFITRDHERAKKNDDLKLRTLQELRSDLGINSVVTIETLSSPRAEIRKDGVELNEPLMVDPKILTILESAGNWDGEFNQQMAEQGFHSGENGLAENLDGLKWDQEGVSPYFMAQGEYDFRDQRGLIQFVTDKIMNYFRDVRSPSFRPVMLSRQVSLQGRSGLEILFYQGIENHIATTANGLRWNGHGLDKAEIAVSSEGKGWIEVFDPKGSGRFIPGEPEGIPFKASHPLVKGTLVRVLRFSESVEDILEPVRADFLAHLGQSSSPARAEVRNPDFKEPFEFVANQLNLWTGDNAWFAKELAEVSEPNNPEALKWWKIMNALLNSIKGERNAVIRLAGQLGDQARRESPLLAQNSYTNLINAFYRHYQKVGGSVLGLHDALRKAKDKGDYSFINYFNLYFIYYLQTNKIIGSSEPRFELPDELLPKNAAEVELQTGRMRETVQLVEETQSPMLSRESLKGLASSLQSLRQLYARYPELNKTIGRIYEDETQQWKAIEFGLERNGYKIAPEDLVRIINFFHSLTAAIYVAANPDIQWYDSTGAPEVEAIYKEQSYILQNSKAILNAIYSDLDVERYFGLDAKGRPRAEVRQASSDLGLRTADLEQSVIPQSALRTPKSEVRQLAAGLVDLLAPKEAMAQVQNDLGTQLENEIALGMTAEDLIEAMLEQMDVILSKAKDLEVGIPRPGPRNDSKGAEENLDMKALAPLLASWKSLVSDQKVTLLLKLTDNAAANRDSIQALLEQRKSIDRLLLLSEEGSVQPELTKLLKENQVFYTALKNLGQAGKIQLFGQSQLPLLSKEALPQEAVLQNKLLPVTVSKGEADAEDVLIELPEAVLQTVIAIYLASQDLSGKKSMDEIKAELVSKLKLDPQVLELQSENGQMGVSIIRSQLRRFLLEYQRAQAVNRAA